MRMAIPQGCRFLACMWGCRGNGSSVGYDQSGYHTINIALYSVSIVLYAAGYSTGLYVVGMCVWGCGGVGLTMIGVGGGLY